MSRHYHPRIIVIALVTALALAGCAGSVEDAPARAVERYFEALVDGDATTARSLSCAEWESFAANRVSTFESLDAELVDPGCTVTSTDGDTAQVACTGNITVTYGTEDQELPLTSYRVVQEGGEWLMCGETE